MNNLESFALNPIQLDALTEIGNIGAGHAATVLSQLLGERINITVPRINIVPLASASEIVGGPEVVVVGIYLRVFGDAPSSILFVFPRQAAMQLVDILVGRNPGTTNLLREYEQSALKEIGNILTGAFLYALSTFMIRRVTDTCGSDRFGSCWSRTGSRPAPFSARAFGSGSGVTVNAVT